MARKILGLDLGSTSIGWAMVTEAENENEKSSIIKIGSRIIQYGDNLVKVDKTGKITPSMEPEKDFLSGKGLSPNAGRTKQRSARRNLQRFKLRRENLILILKEHKIIPENFIFSEEGNASTFKTYKNRSLAAKEKIPLDEFVRILFMINKKRGYKSSRKAKGEDEGQLIDGMSIAKILYENNLTPGQYVYSLMREGKNFVPDFYRSDLYSEFDRIWHFQEQFEPSVLSKNTYDKLYGQKKNFTKFYFEKELKIELPDLKGKYEEKKVLRYELRSRAITEQISLSEMALVLSEINGDINNSSGYLGAISDRSKELYFQKKTVGQFLFEQIEKNPNTSLKKQVFYRQDYLDEFNIIWDVQAKFHKKLTPELKSEIREAIIFYQRRLKSQKGLISFCEFENRQIEVLVNGKKAIKKTGSRVIPKSSPLFQDFKIWQILNNIEITENSKTKRWLTKSEKETLYEELSVKTKISKNSALRILFGKSTGYDMNFKDLDGHKTNAALYEAYARIAFLSGHEEKDFNKMKVGEIKEYVRQIFEVLGIKSEILECNTTLDREVFEKQPYFQLWHLLYSFEGDGSKTGNQKLIHSLKSKFGFPEEYANIIANIALPDDYGNLSAKAIRKILPHLKNGFAFAGRNEKPDELSACELAGYRHSKSSLTNEEKDLKTYKEKLDLLPKNSLRNPIVEKILNQMVHVVNSAIDEFGKPDEIRLELARELKMSAEEREKKADAMADSSAKHEMYRKILQTEFGLVHVSRNDLIRYKLYLELKPLGFKTLYSKTYISPNELFSNKFDIEHILPKAKIYDDSFSNKTIELKSINLEKGDKTAYDFVKEKYGTSEAEMYVERVNDLFYQNKVQGTKEIVTADASKIVQKISKSKRDKLLITSSNIPDGFIERELRESQYIAKKAKEMMEAICKDVTTTTGSVTDRLREDWQLIDIMKELNWNKYKALGLTQEFTNRDGNVVGKITEWTKRNDHRHHAMDAITVAFTKHSHVQYLNNVNARNDKTSDIYGIEHKELYRDRNNRLRFKPPIPLDEFRAEAKKQLENTLISFKANNKVVTNNKNKLKTKNHEKSIIQLTPRGQLHKETIYGSIKQYKSEEIKVGGTLTLEIILRVAKKSHREALLKRMAEFGNNATKSFSGKNSLEKNPIYLDKELLFKLPEKVKIVSQETVYTIRKDISPDLKIEKVIDPKIRKILTDRLKDFNNNPKQAFSNLDDNPIWLNKEKDIKIKRVTITGITNAIALHDKKNKDGQIILDTNGEKIENDFVSTGNNHHVAIYRDDKGTLQEKVVSFMEAVERTQQGLPVVDQNYNRELGWQFLFTMKQNECFVFPNEKTGFNPQGIDLENPDNYQLISQNLYRVQKLTSKDYFFRHHLETTVEMKKELINYTYKRLGLNGLRDIKKVKLNHLGIIKRIGE